MFNATRANPTRLLSSLPSFSKKEEHQQQQQGKDSTMVKMSRKHSLCTDTTRTDTTERSSSFSCHSLVEGEQMEDDCSASSSAAASFECEDIVDDDDDDLMFATQQDVTNLLQDIHQCITATQTQQDKLQAIMDECWTLAETRYTAGSIVATRIALKRRHAKRLKLGRLAAQQCAYLEMYNEVQDEWQRAQSFVTSNDCLVDVDVTFYRRTLAKVEEETLQATAAPAAALERTMPELWKELQENMAS